MNQLDWEKKHYKRVAGYAKQMDEIFTEAAKEAAAIGALFDANDLFSQPFNFKDYPQTKQRVDKMMQDLHKGVSTVVVNGATAEWENSNLVNDQLAMRVLGIANKDQIPDKFRKYFNNNNQALKAFLERKEKGLNLSDRVWKYTNAFKQEIELGLDAGIRAGKPASEMARDLKQYLREPNKLFRRVRDQHGNLQLSRAAKAYHPGRGVYRSSYKNAMRLTRTETNMAYRAANHTRMQQLDFVVGIEVRLTNNPAHIYDICDELKGRYPKDFKFVGWHPHCMCHAITILKTPQELDQDIEKIQNGEPINTASQNKVEGLPQNFKEWAERNKDRIATAKSQPYFIRDNFTGAKVEDWFKNQQVVPAVAIPAPVEVPMAQRVLAKTDEETLLKQLAEVKDPMTTPEQLLKNKEIKEEIRSAFGEDSEQWVRDNWAKSKNMQPKTYYRYDGAGGGYAGMGNGLYLGRDPKALDAFYNQFGDRELPLFTFKGDPKWLDIADPRRKKIWEEYLAKKRIDPLNSNLVGKEVRKLGFDGIKYFDAQATGEEFVLFNTKVLKRKLSAKEVSAARHAARTPEQRAAIQKAWDERKQRLTPAPKPSVQELPGVLREVPLTEANIQNRVDFYKRTEPTYRYTRDQIENQIINANQSRKRAIETLQKINQSGVQITTAMQRNIDELIAVCNDQNSSAIQILTSRNKVDRLFERATRNNTTSSTAATARTATTRAATKPAPAPKPAPAKIEMPKLEAPDKPKPYNFETEYRKLKKNEWRVASGENMDVSGFSKAYKSVMGDFNLTELDREINALTKKNGIKIESRKIIYDKGRNSFEIEINGHGPDDTRFSLIREFRISKDIKTIDHALLVVPKSLQGNNFTKNLFQSLYKQYKNGNFQEIKVHANIDVGGYAWGRYGFSTSLKSIDDFIRDYKKALTSTERMELSNFYSDWKKQNPNAKKFPMRQLADQPYGKKMMLGSDWFGSIDLTDVSARKIFEDYLFFGK